MAAKPLHMEAWLLLTAYTKSPSPYLTAPSSISYDLPFSHNFVTDRRQINRHIVTKRQTPKSNCKEVRVWFLFFLHESDTWLEALYNLWTSGSGLA